MKKHLGIYLRKLREEKKMTQACVAKYLNVEAQYISNVERLTCKPSKKMLSAYVKYMSADKEYLKDHLRCELEDEIQRYLK